MRLHFGPLTTPDFNPADEGWTPLKEPSPWVLNWVALPTGIVTAVVIALAWGEVKFHFVANSAWGVFAPLVYVAGAFFVGFPTLIATHELLHAVGYPKFGLTPATVIGLWPSKLIFYAAHLDAVGRNRLLLVYALPLVVLSILPTIVCRTLGTTPIVCVLVSTANALFAGGDVFCFFLILLQVPSAAVVRNQGYATWWRRVT